MAKSAAGRSAGRSGSVGTPATAALARAGVPHVLHRFEHQGQDSGFGLEAAAALALEPERVFKTLIVQLQHSLAVGIVPVSGSLDLKAMAAVFGQKRAVLADPEAAQRRTGYVLGGISPFGQRQSSPTVLDASAAGFETILVSGGRRGLDIELSPAVILELTGAQYARIGTV